MKKLLIVFLPLFLFAQNFDELIKLLDNSNIIKIEKEKINLASKKIDFAKGFNYGVIEADFNYIRLKETPIIKMQLSKTLSKSEIEAGNKNNYIAEIKYFYPIFSGFAISSNINKEKLNLIKQKLILKEVKKSLKLKLAKLYSQTFAINKKIKALYEAKKALNLAKEKATAMYEMGLINLSQLKEIEAKYFEIEADIIENNSIKNSLLNKISYLVNKKINLISNLKKIAFYKPNFLNRDDIKIIKTTLKIDNESIKEAKSAFYPKINLIASYKKNASNFGLNKNEHQNIDKSYIGINLKYNLFNGNKDKIKINLLKLSKKINKIFLDDYLNKIKLNYQNNLIKLNALKTKLNAIKKELIARKKYFELIEAKFNEGLTSSTDLNKAISKLALTKAKIASLKAKIFFLSYKLKLDGAN